MELGYPTSEEAALLSERGAREMQDTMQLQNEILQQLERLNECCRRLAEVQDTPRTASSELGFDRARLWLTMDPEEEQARTGFSNVTPPAPEFAGRAAILKLFEAMTTSAIRMHDAQKTPIRFKGLPSREDKWDIVQRPVSRLPLVQEQLVKTWLYSEPESSANTFSNFLPAASKHRVIMVLGTPGSGKSHFIRHLAVALSSSLRAFNEEADNEWPRLPLKGYINSNDVSIQEGSPNKDKSMYSVLISYSQSDVDFTRHLVERMRESWALTKDYPSPLQDISRWGSTASRPSYVLTFDETERLYPEGIWSNTSVFRHLTFDECLSRYKTSQVRSITHGDLQGDNLFAHLKCDYFGTGTRASRIGAYDDIIECFHECFNASPQRSEGHLRISPWLKGLLSGPEQTSLVVRCFYDGNRSYKHLQDELLGESLTATHTISQLWARIRALTSLALSPLQAGHRAACVDDYAAVLRILNRIRENGALASGLEGTLPFDEYSRSRRSWLLPELGLLGEENASSDVQKGSGNVKSAIQKHGEEWPADRDGDDRDYDGPPLKVEIFEDDDLTTIDGFVIVDRRRAFITLKRGLNEDAKQRGMTLMLRYARRNSDMGVYYWNITDTDADIENNYVLSLFDDDDGAAGSNHDGDSDY